MTAALGGLILRGIGVSEPLAGVDPDTVRFLPIVGVEKGSGMGVGFCGAKESPSSSAAVKRYLAFLLRTTADISAS